MQAKHLARESDRTMRHEKNQGRQPNVEQILYIICIFHSFFFYLLIISIYLEWFRLYFLSLFKKFDQRHRSPGHGNKNWAPEEEYPVDWDASLWTIERVRECENRQTTEENGTKSNTIVNFNSFTRPMMMLGGREGEEAFVVFRVDEQKCMRKKINTHPTNERSLFEWQWSNWGIEWVTDGGGRDR